tara:strand:+ start:245 stop:535 length:291 start_codon:yes stop_codon:yes gene_type:complete
MNIEELYPDILCPISHQIMIQPVITNTGITYEKKFLYTWLEENKLCPVTKKIIDKDSIVPNIQLKNTIINLEDKFMFHTNANKNLINENNKCCSIS